MDGHAARVVTLDDEALARANKRELRAIILAYRFLALSRGASEADMAEAERIGLGRTLERG